ncbi:V-type proton ATPase subunit s1 [Plakobranchus ocellatus]|uniref:V-type proton ATPase subunit s1 n=1 Tax=Plakobranchus ocellatus TaxID=259542 RepID=A0AAV4BTT3_9GAST|nr:V-type proton ATPase subunit s1 [Plakobranchus ocellatus]
MSDLPEASGVQPVSSNELLEYYLNPLMQQSSESAVLFLQDKLHVDDFTKFADVYSLDSSGGAFKNIKRFMEEHFSLELPQIENPLQAIDKLKSSFAGALHTATSLSDVEKLDLAPNKKFLLIVELTPSARVGDKEQAITLNDAFVGSICRHLQKRGIKYTAMFTGKSTAENEANEVETFSGRHLLETAETKNGTFMNVSGSIFVFLRDVTVHLQAEDTHIIINATVTEESADKSDAGNSTAIVQLDLSGVSQNTTGDYTVQILFNTTHEGDRWTIQNILLSVNGPASGAFNGTLENARLQTGDIDLVVPILYSYHCSSMKLYVDNIRDESLKSFKHTFVELDGFQMQPFNIQGNAFFNAQDCVGFFTRGIWMGIFTSIILLSILMFGTLMVLNLSTPDRFDDPKGKTIVIAQTED